MLAVTQFNQARWAIQQVITDNMAPHAVGNALLTLTCIDRTSYHWHDLLMTHDLCLLTLPLQISNNTTDLSHVTALDAQLDHCKCCSALHTPSNTARAGYVRNNGTNLTLEHWNTVYIWTLEQSVLWNTGTQLTLEHRNWIEKWNKTYIWTLEHSICWNKVITLEHWNTADMGTLEHR